MRNWFSTVTNLAYLVLLFFGDWYTKLSHLALAATSGRYHWNEHKREFMGEQWYGSIDWLWQKGDISSIYFSFLFIIAYLLGGGLLSLLMIPLGVVLSLAEFDIIDHDQIKPNHTLIGVLALLACIIKIGENPLMGWTALGCFIIAIVIEAVLDNDTGHGLWHLLTSTGKVLLLY